MNFQFLPAEMNFKNSLFSMDLTGTRFKMLNAKQFRLVIGIT